MTGRKKQKPSRSKAAAPALKKQRRKRFERCEDMRSLALDRKDRAIGIILSGTGTDGTPGLTVIKGKSGIEMVLLRERKGHEFSGCKISMIRPRMNLHQIRDANQYLHHLQGNPHELDILFIELLTGVTSFFRDAEAFEALADDALVRSHLHLFQESPPPRSTRPAIARHARARQIKRSLYIGCQPGGEVRVTCRFPCGRAARKPENRLIK